MNYLSNGNGNGVLAKLSDLRHDYLASTEAARVEFVGKIKAARDDYLGQVVDVTLGDPRLADLERSLEAWETPTQPVQVPGPAAVSTENMVPINPSGEPDKFPLKANRGPPSCPNCGTFADAGANFCSRCATPLFDDSGAKLREWSRTRRR